MAPNHHRSGGGGGGPGGGSGGHRGHREHHSSGNRDRDRDYRSRDRSHGHDRYDDRSRRDRRDRERAIIQGKGKKKAGPGPDDVTILMQQDEELKNQLALVVQLEGTDGERSTLEELGEKITITCKECFRKKPTAIYIVAFVLSLLMLIHMCVMISKDGMPISDSSNGADSRALISLVGTVIISLLAFMILNLRILNLALGLTWMFLIVSLNYNISTSLSNAAYFIYRFNHNEKQSFDNVFIYMERRYHDDYDLKDDAFIHNFLHKKRCCDFDQFTTEVHVEIPGQTAVKADYSFWDAVFQNETADINKKHQRRPLVCCQIENLAGSHCYANTVGSYPTVQLTTLCAKRQLLAIIKKHMLFALAYMIVLEFLSVGMALVFWYYYSDMKALEFAKQDQPGDFALLNLTVHVSDSAAAAAPVETEQEKLANEKRQKRIELLKKKYGMRDGRGHGHGHGHHHGQGHGHHGHGHGHRHGGHGHHHGHGHGGDRSHDSSRHHGHHESRHGEHGQGHSSSRHESSHHRDRDRDGDRDRDRDHDRDRDRDRDREHHHHSDSPNRSSSHRH